MHGVPPQAPAQSWVLTGDALSVLKRVADCSIHCCATSPPYFGLRDYGMDAQIGLEASPAEYVAKLVEVFRDVRRVLRDDGTLWLNLGDSYARDPGKGQHKPGDAGKQNHIIERGGGRSASTVNLKSETQGSSDGQVGQVGRGDRAAVRNGATGLKAKDLIGVPWLVAFALRADGWYLRQDIIWAKPNPMPESVQDRCTKSHEYLFLLSKNERYYFDSAAIAEEALRPEGGGNVTHKGATAYAAGDTKMRTKVGLAVIGPRAMRNKRSVWTITPKPYKEAHFATFPPALVEPCIKAGCPENGVVLDPFAGSGTTGMVANQLKRNALLIELNPAYVELIKKRLA